MKKILRRRFSNLQNFLDNINEDSERYIGILIFYNEEYLSAGDGTLVKRLV